MAERAKTGEPPWDPGCGVETYVGGYAAMCAIRDTLEKVIADASRSSNAPGSRGHVYFADWRMNAQRDLSDGNSWVTHTWHLTDRATTKKDQTAIGLLLRLMQAGVRVRVLLWLPTTRETMGAGEAHIEDHYYIARVVGEEARRLGDETLGIVALDARVAEGSWFGTHHQKTIVVRSLDTHVAFVGGVDLAFTRRDAPAKPSDPGATEPRFHDGEWQSANGVPTFAGGWVGAPTAWPPDDTTNYTSVGKVAKLKHRQGADLPPETDKGGLTLYAADNQIWHDQHLQLSGKIVKTLEEQFGERWVDTADVFSLAEPERFFAGQVIFSTRQAYDAHGVIIKLPDATDPTTGGGSSTVQMWRTIPWRDSRTGPPFRRGEFTVMSGVAHAAGRAEQLIWIFDQYFWTQPLARQINARLQDNDGLRVIVVLPPWADTHPGTIHRARKDALDALVNGVEDQVGVYNLWDPRGKGRGIYCHAKVQTYDGALLVCGSANLNRRSLNCDSELACAVADPAVVAQHHSKLWSLLFGDTGAAWPGPITDDNGAEFFRRFVDAAKLQGAYLTPDPWRDNPPKLPSQAVRDVDWHTPKFFALYDRIFDPTSIDRVCEGPVGAQKNGQWVIREAHLDEVVTRIETCVRLPSGRILTPWRRQS
jgi:phosphatidylserine/phosphatidylglycerophosphate/cardiolipin synthase-like enzyme